MTLSLRPRLIARSALGLMLCMAPLASFAQQVVQRGALGRPAGVLDETNQWTAPLLLSSDHDVELYIPDISSPEWLERNYPDYRDKSQFTLSMFTFYRTPRACRANQIAWGNSDGAHLDECLSIGYRLRRGLVDSRQKTVTLIAAAMVDQSGMIQDSSIRDEPLTKSWADLDDNTQKALQKAAGLVAEQMKIYDLKVQHKLQ